MVAPWTLEWTQTWLQYCNFIPWPFLKHMTPSAVKHHHEGQNKIKRKLGFPSILCLCGFPFGLPIHFD